MINTLFYKFTSGVLLTLILAKIAIAGLMLEQIKPEPSLKSVIKSDPIFTLDYDVSKANFEVLRTGVLLPACRKAISSVFKKVPQHLTLYAFHANVRTTIYIVGSEDVNGLFVIRDGVCEGGAPELSMYQLYSKPPHPPGCPVLSDVEVSALFEDTLIRYEKAFGSKDRFIKWLDETTETMRSGCKGLPDIWCPTTYHSFQPYRKKILNDYRK